jgi:hypothetical protein
MAGCRNHRIARSAQNASIDGRRRHANTSVSVAAMLAALLVAVPLPARASEAQRYSYDARARIVQVSHIGSVNEGASASYQYDRADNRTKVTAITSWTSRALRTGDFNGDGKSDILLRDDTSSGASQGVIDDYLSNSGGNWTDNWSNATGGADLTWKIAAVGDFNGDGRADILWQKDGGGTSDWLGTPTGGFTDNGGVAYLNVGPSWNVVGVGDFNGDGRADILWRNNDGIISDWLAQGDGSFVDNGANSAASVPSWHPIQVADFNGDGRADILWHQDGTDIYSEWLGTSSGGFFDNGSTAAFGVSGDWKVVAAADINGDGKSDILWRNDSGLLCEWVGTSTGAFNSTGPCWALPTNYRIAAIGDFNGDHCDDVLWRNTAGVVSNWLGTSTGDLVINYASDASVATTWNVEPR